MGAAEIGRRKRTAVPMLRGNLKRERRVAQDKGADAPAERARNGVREGVERAACVNVNGVKRAVVRRFMLCLLNNLGRS